MRSPSRFAIPESAARGIPLQAGQHLTLRATLDGEEAAAQLFDLLGPGDDATAHRHQARGGRALLDLGQRDACRPAACWTSCRLQGRFVLPAGEGARGIWWRFAAGAGITPIMAMIKQALTQEPDTSFTLVYGNRTPETILFREELEDLKDRHLGRFTLLHVLVPQRGKQRAAVRGPHHRRKGEGAVATSCSGPDEVGARVPVRAGFDDQGDAQRAARHWGCRASKVHHEFFAPAGGAYRKVAAELPPPPPPLRRKSEARRREGEGEAVAILDGIRHRFIVPPGGHVVDAALAAGIRVPYACKGGMCCTCRAKLVEGKAEMTTNYSLEPWEIERGFILTCQAVPKSERLVLDYDQM